MLKILRVVLGLGLCLCALPARADDAEVIHRVFNTFQSQLLAGDTAKAETAFAPSLLSYYDKLRPMAGTTSSATPADQPLVDQLVVEILRHYVGPSATRMSLAEVSAQGIRNGWIQLKGFEDIHLGNVTVTGETASAMLIVKQSPTSWRVPFRKVDGDWKIDPLAFYTIGDFLLKAEALRNGWNNRDQTIRNIVASMAPKKKA